MRKIFLCLLFLNPLIIYCQGDFCNKIAGDTSILLKSISTYELNYSKNDTLFIKYSKLLYRVVLYNNEKSEYKSKVTLYEGDKKISSSFDDVRKIDNHYLDFFTPNKSSNYKLVFDYDKKNEDFSLGKLYLIYPGQINEPAADFSFVDLQGDTLALKKLKGKVIVLNFWGISCKPCVAEIPDLNSLVDKYSGNPDVAFIGLSPNNTDDLNKFLIKRKFKYKIVSDKSYNYYQTQYRIGDYVIVPFHQ